MVFEIVATRTYSGGRAEERPLSFVFREDKIVIDEIIDRWYEAGQKAGGPVYNYFKVRSAEDIYILRHNLRHDVWSVMLNLVK